MPDRPHRILALGHDAYRAGAQIEFLHLLRWLRANRDWEMSLVLGAGGALRADYEAVLPTTVLGKDPTGPNGARASLRNDIKDRLRANARQLRRPEIDLVYANSSASAVAGVEMAQRAGCPVVCHVHELEFSMRRFAGRFDEVRDRIDRFIAVSHYVERNLIEAHGVDPALIHVVNGAVRLPERGGHREDVRSKLQLPDDAFVVGGCGTLDWRKAPEVFLAIASEVAASRPEQNVRFVWVGGDAADIELMRHDVDRMHLSGTVDFVGVQADPTSYFECFDVFLLTSREDPFPLVCLEAAALGVPTVCFSDAGGMPEFVEDDAGCVVDYLSVRAATACLLALADDPVKRAALGRRAAERVVERCSLDVIGPRIADVLDRAATLGPAGRPGRA